MDPKVAELQLGKFLQIAFSEGVRDQISSDFRDWEHIKSVKEGDPNGRELRFFLKQSHGPSAVQSRSAGSAGVFPGSQQSRNTEHSAEYKEIDVTIQLEYALWNRARKSIAKYAEPLMNEIEDKMIASKRYMSSKLYQDGSGIYGVVASVTDDFGNDRAVVTLDQSDAVAGYSHVGYFEYDEILAAYQDTNVAPASVATRPATGGVPTNLWKVVDRDRQAGTITVEPLLANLTTNTSASASNLVAGDFFTKYEQEIILTPAYAAANPTTVDYGKATDVIVGLESLAAADGRLVHGMTMSGALKGTEVNAGGDPLDSTQIRRVLDEAKIRAGEQRYSYKKICLAPEAEAAFIESRETDRRFHTVEDNTRGTYSFRYQHRNDAVETYTSEFVPFKRAYILPEQTNGDKVLEYHGSDFEKVAMSGMSEFHLKPSSNGGFERNVVCYMEAIGQLICKHPAAIGRLRNFTI